MLSVINSASLPVLHYANLFTKKKINTMCVMKYYSAVVQNLRNCSKTKDSGDIPQMC